MNPSGRASEISEHVVSYCEAIEVPAFDEALFARAHPVRGRRIARRRQRLGLATSLALAVMLFGVLCNIHAVVAGVQHVFRAFAVATGQATPLTIRTVDLERARADMPFAVIEPPPIVAAPLVTIGELYADASASHASVIFELHAATSGQDIMIIESDAAKRPSKSLFALRGTMNDAGPTALQSLESLLPSGSHKPELVLRESSRSRIFTPATWVAHGTRIVVMGPPGFLSTAQLQAIRRSMSR